MHDVFVKYVGDLRCEVSAEGDTQVIPMDAPAHYGGRGETISPTEMVGASLGGCMLTMIVVAGRRHDLDLSAATMRVKTTLSVDRPPRITRFDVDVAIPVDAGEEQRLAIEAASGRCPVRASIHPDIELAVNFCWGG